MLQDKQRREIADCLIKCLKEKKQIGLINKDYPEIEIEDSYCIQTLIIDAFKKSGQVVKGYKVGLTSDATQDRLGANEPIFSAVTNDFFKLDGSTVKRTNWISPQAEIELAFVMKASLSGQNVNVADVIQAIDYILPSIELADLRVAIGPGIDVRDIVADLSAAGAIVLGNTPVPIADIDICDISGQLIINDKVMAEGGSSAVLGNPLHALVWLVNKLSTFGVSIQAGDVIMSGALADPVPVTAGDRVIARFNNGFGDVEINFD